MKAIYKGIAASVPYIAAVGFTSAFVYDGDTVTVTAIVGLILSVLLLFVMLKDRSNTGGK